MPGKMPRNQFSEDQSPLITTIIPTYRRPQMLKTSVRSVLSQTFEDFQVIIYDNASGDETAAVAAELMREDSRVKYFCHPRNIGMVPNFNYAMERVITPFFSFLCDDDLLLPGFYETTLAGFRRYPDAASSCGVCMFTDSEGLIARRGPCIMGKEYFTPPEGLLAWRHETKPLLTANLLRREVIPTAGPFSERGYMDMEWEMRLVAQFPYVVSASPCAVITMHEEHGTKEFSLDAGLWWEGYEIIEKSLRQVNNLPSSTVEAALDRLKMEFGRQVYRMGRTLILKGEMVPVQKIVIALRENYQLSAEADRLDRAVRHPVLRRCGASLYTFIRHLRNLAIRWKTRKLRVRLYRYRAAPYRDFAV